MNSNYKVLKFKSKNLREVDDQVSIEEPLEIIIKYKDKENWIENTISITCLLYTSPSPRDQRGSRMPSSA